MTCNLLTPKRVIQRGDRFAGLNRRVGRERDGGTGRESFESLEMIHGDWIIAVMQE